MNGDFASGVEEKPKRGFFKTLWRIGKWPTIIFAGISAIAVLFLAGLGGVNAKQLSVIYNQGMAGKAAIEHAQQAVLEQNFAEATYSLQRAQENFRSVHNHIEKLVFLDVVPGIKKQLYAVDQISIVGAQLASAIETFTYLGEDLAETLRTDGEVNIATLEPEQKREILKKLAEAPPQLVGAKADIALASEALDNIPETGLLGPLADAISPLKEQLPDIQKLYDSSLPIIEVLPWIAGYPDEQVYLFLLQNNNELRPTGGFIGTYGVLKLKDGEIVSFETDNIYNIDEQAKPFAKELPRSPEPIKRYIGQSPWWMRDSNWSPDFPTAAQEALAAYEREGGPVQEFDGVIAITPTFISSLMELTGPITVEGVEFTSENLTDELQFQVEAAFKEKGIELSDRKEIIGTLSDELMARIMATDKAEFPHLWEIFIRNVNEKHILVYMENDYAQELVEQQNWSGSIKHTEDDYFMVIDANLAALKTDKVMDRDIDYTVSLEEDGLIGRLKITYNHTGVFDFFTTRYRTWTRIYLPPGTELRSATGFMDADFYQGGQEVEPDVGEENYKVVVSGFTSIEPKMSKTIELEYKLPDKIKDRMLESSSYSLLAQKQAGTLGHDLTFTFDVGQGITWREPYLDTSRIEGNNKVIFETDLKEDREFYIEYE